MMKKGMKEIGQKLVNLEPHTRIFQLIFLLYWKRMKYIWSNFFYTFVEEKYFKAKTLKSSENISLIINLTKISYLYAKCVKGF